MIFTLILLTLILHIHCNTDIHTTISIKNQLENDLDQLNITNDSNNNNNNNTETDSSILYPNVTYVILPTVFYLGQTNLITVRSRQPNTQLYISMNVTELLPTIINNSNQIYLLKQLNTTENFYGLDIPYKIPFIFTHDHSIWVKLIFHFIHCLNKINFINNQSCIDFNTTEIIHSIQLKQLPLITLGETDKPIYKPGEYVHFRFLTLNINNLLPISTNIILPNKKLIIDKGSKGQLIEMNSLELIKWNSIIYDSITIIDPMENHIKQWLNITPKQAYNLTFPLLHNSKEGKWRIHAIIKYHNIEIIEFTVKKYTLPKFTITLETPKNFTIESKYIQYSICAKYTNGPPLKGYIQSILCACNEYIWDKQFSQLDNEQIIQSLLNTPKCPSDHYEINTRSCIIINQPLETNGCKLFNISTNLFALTTNQYSKWQQISILCAQIIEEDTNSKLYNCIKGDLIEQNNQPNIQLELPQVYKSKLPILGKVKLKNFDKTINYNIKLSVTDQKWGCYWQNTDQSIEHYLNILTMNSSGESIFYIPPIKSKHSISVEAELLQSSISSTNSSSSSSSLTNETNSNLTINKNNTKKLIHQNPSDFYYWSYKQPWIQENKIIESVILRSWDSINEIYLQLWPPRDKISTTCPNVIKLTLLSNIRLSDKTIFIESVIRGKHQKIVIPSSNKISDDLDHNDDDDCINRDDELGHYNCLNKNSTEIECLPGWYGENCLIPICSLECNKNGGFCSKPNQCQCKSGWTGITCNQCIPRENCLHGKCLLGNDCVCNSGWTGYLCDSKNVIYEKFKDDSVINNTETITEEIINQQSDNDSITNSSFEKINMKPIRTLYQRNIEFHIDGSWGPKFTAIIYFHHYQFDQMIPEIISTQLIIEQIDYCSSNAIALQSITNQTNFKLSQMIANPGEKIKMIINPQGISQSMNYSNIKSIKFNNDNDHGQLLNELCFIRISDISLDNYQGDKNLINLQYFVNQLIEFTRENEYRPLVASSTQEAFLAAGFQFGSTYPEPTFIQRVYPCPYLAYSNTLDIVMDDSVGDSGYKSNTGYPQTVSLRKDLHNIMKPRLRDFFPEVWLFDVIPITNLPINNAAAAADGDDDDDDDDNENDTEFKQINTLKGIELNLTVPDTITSWRASAYCTTKENGLWISEPQILTVTMPFYTEITLPKEMKRGEILHIPISIFILDRKYLNPTNDHFNQIECYETIVKIQLNNTEWLITTSNEFIGCICTGEKLTYLVGLLPQQLGHLNVTVEAFAIKHDESCKSIQTNNNNNNNESLTFEPYQTQIKINSSKILSDKITRQIHVIPEGIQQETTFSDIICLNEQQTISMRQFEFIIPNDMIKDSLYSYISYSDEVLGPALVNLDNLIRLPTGCGEQNMILVAPNVYILDYLKSISNININNNKEKYIQSAQSNIISGYYQQMKYRRNDGSFSAFGKSDKHGNTWLTSFIIRVFAKAYIILQSNITIDWNYLFNDAINYLLIHQNNHTGCFEEYGKLLYSPLKGINDLNEIQWNNILLTSYVSLALYKIQFIFNENNYKNKINNLHIKNYTTEINQSINAAFNCLNMKLIHINSLKELPTPVLIQLSYIYTIMKPYYNITIKLQNETINRKQILHDQFGTKIFWSINDYQNNTIINKNNYNEPRDLEITAYAFLMLNYINQSIHDLFPIIRWISSKQKLNGGFYSTQDTILSIEAITKFAKRLDLSKISYFNLSSNRINITNKINIKNYTLNDIITPDKRQVINQIELPKYHLNNNQNTIHSIWELKSNQSQTDCILIQNTFMYNIPEKKDINKNIKLSFNIIQQNKLSDIQCKLATLSMCLQLNNIKNINTISTGMLMIHVTMVTGWEPILEELNLQLGSNDESLRKFTINDQNEISLYFDEFSNNELKKLGGDWTKLKRCINLSLKQIYYVQNAKLATITAYEYYTPDESVTITYQLDECKQGWNISIIESSTDNFTESTITTDSSIDNIITPQMKPICPICIDQVNNTELLTDEIFTSVCNYTNGIFLLKVLDYNNSTINVTIIQISQSGYTASWNTTILLPNLIECSCQLIQTHQYLILFFDQYTTIYQGVAQIDLNTLIVTAKFISSQELLPNLKLAYKKWLTISSNLTIDEDSNYYDFFTDNCKRLPWLIKYIEERFMN
ncbi:unnamed protein product [Schistosoma spindalis]|nr:unnamed protein product [Schistosoma spindale]